MDETYETYCDDYSFILERGMDDKGNNCYYGIDIPCKDDPEWRFWILFEDDTVKWNLSDEDKESIKKKLTKYCLENEYTFNGEYFERHYIK